MARPGSCEGIGVGLRAMACHESDVGAEVPCVGWLDNQLGPGNNIPLRIAVAFGSIEADYELDGPQHETFEATLPKRQRG